MPASPDELVENISLLQKQLILAQVQILELEDVRDELQAAVDQRSKALTELQILADRALAEAQEARTAEASAKKAVQASDAGSDLPPALAKRIEALENERCALKSSRSWRWTAPLRLIERLLG